MPTYPKPDAEIVELLKRCIRAEYGSRMLGLPGQQWFDAQDDLHYALTGHRDFYAAAEALGCKCPGSSKNKGTPAPRETPPGRVRLNTSSASGRVRLQKGFFP